MQRGDVGGVHIKYLYHCHRQLWLFARGFRPEQYNTLVQYGEAVHETRYDRYHEVDLGSARLDNLDGEGWVHEIKSSRTPTDADTAQAMHYCYRLETLGVPARGGIQHYPATRRTVRTLYDDQRRTQAEADIAAVLNTIAEQISPPRIERRRCSGCSFTDYCWSE
jgi:CRISPR-associated exonuclease Cas4